jgi:hypothetical protein
VRLRRAGLACVTAQEARHRTLPVAGTGRRTGTPRLVDREVTWQEWDVRKGHHGKVDLTETQTVQVARKPGVKGKKLKRTWDGERWYVETNVKKPRVRDIEPIE